MHQDSLKHVELYCTSCRKYERCVIQYPLKLIPAKTSGDYVLTGWLECTYCNKRYPIMDGVPILVQVSSSVETLLAQYIDAHYEDLNTVYWQEMKSVKSRGLCLDVGCSVGRYSFECASWGFTVGLDINFEHLKIAAEIQRTGMIEYTRKNRALSTEKKIVQFSPSANVLFILADIHNPPFKMEMFDFISALNVLDSVKRPLTALGQMDAMLKPNGTLFLSTPYVWNPEISEDWLETMESEPHDFIKLLLTGKNIPETGFKYQIIEEKKNIPWYIRQQDALLFTYFVDKIVAKKSPTSQ